MTRPGSYYVVIPEFVRDGFLLSGGNVPVRNGVHRPSRVN